MADMRLELVPVPVSEINRAKAFYAEKMGFNVDHDVQPAEGIRFVQLTPPGSSCSIVLSEGAPGIEMDAGTLRGLHLVVSNLEQQREALLKNGVDVSGVNDVDGILFAHLSDLDGNTWVLQEIPEAIPPQPSLNHSA